MSVCVRTRARVCVSVCVENIPPQDVYNSPPVHVVTLCIEISSLLHINNTPM